MGFNFIARPAPRVDSSQNQFQKGRVDPESKKGRLNKRMTEKGRITKVGRAMNVAIAAPKHNQL
ncbi:unnamed protein product [Heterosigma akashiwo]